MWVNTVDSPYGTKTSCLRFLSAHAANCCLPLLPWSTSANSQSKNKKEISRTSGCKHIAGAGTLRHNDAAMRRRQSHIYMGNTGNIYVYTMTVCGGEHMLPLLRSTSVEARAPNDGGMPNPHNSSSSRINNNNKNNNNDARWQLKEYFCSLWCGIYVFNYTCCPCWAYKSLAIIRGWALLGYIWQTETRYSGLFAQWRATIGQV